MVCPDAIDYDTGSKGIAGMGDGVSQFTSTATHGEWNGELGPQYARRCASHRAADTFRVAADKDMGFVHAW